MTAEAAGAARRRRRNLGTAARGRALPEAFFDRPAEAVARDLLGKTLVRRRRGRTVRWTLWEVEAYVGRADRASHAHRGPTRRNEPMFGSPRRWYVYRIYGLHWMLNVVTGPGTEPTAVLIRAGGPATGPAGVCARLGIDGRWSGRPATPAAGLWIEDAPRSRRATIQALPRVGIAYAGPYWARRRLRFRLGCVRGPARRGTDALRGPVGMPDPGRAGPREPGLRRL